ncbi:helix-turn-helix domain-containing protein [Thermomonospora amylolytica]|uniref:helix-turn-helix domain-containing protein n=1 Tax=Thermomonospora amylolytica TaxID=1411117 RepID=UPI000E6D24EC|nr:AraC family transcriptional regulator [Thermomonospora amylolytica]
MDSRTEESIQRAIKSIHQNIDKRITIDDMAKTAMFSKFHFTRLFQRMTGVSPGRFLSAVRLEEAKKLLLTTSLSVTEITYRVGYNSVGTFSTRFKNSVGLSPTAYRELHGFTPRICDETRRPGKRTAVVHGDFATPDSGGAQGTVFIGLFPDTIPQGTPVRCTILDRPGPFRLESVPEGVWYLLAQCVPSELRDRSDAVPVVAAHGPIEIRPGTITPPLELRLRPMQLLDPPVLMALTDVRRTALSSAAS